LWDNVDKKYYFAIANTFSENQIYVKDDEENYKIYGDIAIMKWHNDGN
jgi:hypothetical protein